MKKLWLAIAVLVLSGCAKDYAMEMKPGYHQGDYKVVSFEIYPENESMAKDQEFQVFAKRVAPLIKNSLATTGQGRPVHLGIKITTVSLEVNFARTVLVGDNYRAGGKIFLKDTQSGQVINEPKYILVQLGGMAGVIGGFVGGSGALEKDEVQRLLYQFTSELMTYVYPSSAHTAL